MSLEWCPPPKPLIMAQNEVHVWRASLDLRPSRLSSLQQVLSGDERQRAERFVAQKDRDAFVAARGLLRLILGRYLGLEPESLHFCYGSYGKPALAPEFNPERLCFNLSHSGKMALYAVALNGELGVDLERLEVLNYEAIAQRFFSSQESATLLALPVNARREAFFNCWTRKEAFVKAQGRSIALLNQFEVSLAPKAAALLSIDGNSQAGTRWTLQALNPGFGYAAALAIAGRTWQIKCWQWQE